MSLKPTNELNGPDSPLTYRRRKASEVKIGNVNIGGENPIALQSMTSTSTMDTDGSVAQAARIIDAGGRIVRLTAQGVREAANLANIRRELSARGYSAPLVADIHFNPKAAEEAALHVEKVRINPGNFVDPGRTFKKIKFTDEEYAAELARIEARLVPFIELCKANSTAIRIGVNHGSLSDRIMSRYGDTPSGMVESAMEFLRVFKRHDFNNVVISIKASNTVVMVETVRRLVAAMESEQMAYPLHLGVTEAGNGEDGRVKSALGIGALLLQGIGDTIRVSLSEDPELEIPVARRLVEHTAKVASAGTVAGEYYRGFDPIIPKSRRGGDGGEVIALGVDDIDPQQLVYIDCDRSLNSIVEQAQGAGDRILVLTSKRVNQAAVIQAAMHRLIDSGVANKMIPQLAYTGLSAEEVVVAASADAGAILLNGFHDGLGLITDNPEVDVASLLPAILQAARLRFSHTEFISCPGCGRTLFDIQSTVNRIKAATAHLPGLKIGVMGCIVNGPGEMADADYGYVGAAAGNVSLYKGKECVEKNIPSEQALDRLIVLLKSEGKWIDPQ
ncbi:MAG: (E)-4-hydroxy-3-methylbut-2-enyl-diphosphate synthase [Muribaculaceae bacterium]|nr:(E)-4-hydroxy-3-methylbut-2-enyl-diphosphate synthase [Muribaculaceae bacterium]